MAILRAGYGLDAAEYIVSDVSKDKIDPLYLPCIEESVQCLNNAFYQQLHSVYVYGSVARGEAVVAKSDLDLIAMLDASMSPAESTELKRPAGALSQKYCALVRGVGSDPPLSGKSNCHSHSAGLGE